MKLERRQFFAGVLATVAAALAPEAAKALPHAVEVLNPPTLPRKAILTSYTYDDEPVYTLFLSDLYADPMFRDGVYHPEAGYPGSCRGSFYALTYVNAQGRTIPTERLQLAKTSAKRL